MFITCCLMGQQKTITRTVMNQTFGFSDANDDNRSILEEFNVNAAWEELTGFTNWHQSRPPAAFIRDHALCFLHKFVSSNVSGIQELSRVNQLEVFLLNSALKGKRVCISSFIWSQMYQMQLHGASLPVFSAIAMGLVRHFEIPVPIAGMELIMLVPLFFDKMKTFLKSEFEF